MESWTAEDLDPMSSLKLTLNIAYPDAVSNSAWVAIGDMRGGNFEVTERHVMALLFSALADRIFSGCHFFRRTKGLTHNAHLLDPRDRLFLLSASRRSRFLL